MQEIVPFKVKQIPIGAKLDVQAIDDELNHLWMENAGNLNPDEDGAMLRARVLNLLAYVSDEATLARLDDLLMDIALVHPCRAIVLHGDETGADKDIEVSIASRCQLAKGAGGQHLCCEEVILRASGRFTLELPSASLPLLVSDLPVYLLWLAPLNLQADVFQRLLHAADRIVIDTALSTKTSEDIKAVSQFLQTVRKAKQGISDLNWSRLAAWRLMLASFYDVPEHLSSLSELRCLRISFVARSDAPNEIPPRPLLLAGWLASRLGWRITTKKAKTNGSVMSLSAEANGNGIDIEFLAATHHAVGAGGITQVELIVGSENNNSFIAMRAEDCRDLETVECSQEQTRTTRVHVGSDKSDLELFINELEILTHDRIYEQALIKSAEMLEDS